MKSAILFVAGIVFAAVGAYFVYVGFTLDVTVAAGDTALPAGMSGIANLQLMQIQSLDIMIGLGSAVIAAIFWGAAAIVGAVESGRPAG